MLTLISYTNLFFLLHHHFTGHNGIVTGPFEEVVSASDGGWYFPGEVVVVMVVGCLCDVFSVDIV